MRNFKKKHNYATAVKLNPKSESKIEERMQPVEKVEDERVPELLIIEK